jgi:hypothetical protein
VTGDLPRRWPDDSPEEDFEVRRAQDIDGLARWTREQKLRPLTDVLGEHGLQRGDGQGWYGPLVLPDWWDEIRPPADPCPWCQRSGVPAPCPECRAARATGVDQPAEWAFWARCTPTQRRVHIAASYSIDPWSGRHCAIRIERTDLDAEGQILTRYPLYFGAAPRGIYWRARRGA